MTIVGAEIPRKPFYCVRHGVTEWNILQKQQGQTDIPLHAIGRQQAERLRVLMDTLSITHFWTSPLSRAYETTGILNAAKKVPVFICDDLKEQGKGVLEGITAQEWNKLDRAVIDAAIENKSIFIERTEHILQSILSYEGTPCIVAHSNNLRAVAQLVGCSITDVPSDVIWYFEPSIDNVWSMTELRVDGQYSPPGKMVDVGGYKLHAYEVGAGNVSVIFDSCLGGNCLEWLSVQAQVAKFAHTVSYDRAGLGWSEASNTPRICLFMVEELRTLLRNAHIQPPYILVGHSSGGITMRYFANKYPDEVIGLILVDSSHERQHEVIQNLKDIFQPPILPKSVYDVSWLPDSLVGVYNYLDAQPTACAASGQERAELDTCFKEISELPNRLLDMPLTVITRGTKVVDTAPLERKPFEEALHAAWLSFQQDLLSKSRYSKQIIAHGCGHHIQRECPELIVAAVRDLVATQVSVRRGTMDDLPAIMALDKRITMEYFVPLAQENLQHIPHCTTIQETFIKELDTTYDSYAAGVQQDAPFALFVAVDEWGCITGFLLCRCQQITLMLSSFLFDHDAVGKKLLGYALQVFPNIQKVTTNVLHCDIRYLNFFLNCNFRIEKNKAYALHPEWGKIYYTMTLHHTLENEYEKSKKII